MKLVECCIHMCGKWAVDYNWLHMYDYMYHITICYTHRYTYIYIYNYINSRSTKHVEVDIYTHESHRTKRGKFLIASSLSQTLSAWEVLEGQRMYRFGWWFSRPLGSGWVTPGGSISWIFGGVWNVALGGWEGWKQKAWKHKIGKTHADWFRKRNESFRML